MSLKYAIMAVLLDGEASGYELAKRFDVSVAHFWHALPQQLYTELKRMERDGLATTTTVVQGRRPNKRVFALSDAGREALQRWVQEPSGPISVKDELLVRLFAADIVDPEALLPGLEERLAQHETKLRAFEALRDALFKGRSEEEYIHTTPRLGPYLPLRCGIAFEQASVAWCQWVAEALRQRTVARSAAPRHRARHGTTADVVNRPPCRQNGPAVAPDSQ